MKKYIKSAEDSKQYFHISYYAGKGWFKGCVVRADNEEAAENYGLQLSRDTITDTYDSLKAEALEVVKKELKVEPASGSEIAYERNHGEIIDI